ncbi:unnamed protein product [Lactuca virosa]|uniref:Uncharacterized protein n=1 Tax=Lactuca virosa TaxID=75947 RepID=A0AAU9PQ30_9ASTR|nr:unnamed protein product [Lactuca virosa]
MASENGVRWTWAEAKQRESGLEGCGVRESAWPVGVRWRETVEEERVLRRGLIPLQGFDTTPSQAVSYPLDLRSLRLSPFGQGSHIILKKGLIVGVEYPQVNIGMESDWYAVHRDSTHLFNLLF